VKYDSSGVAQWARTVSAGSAYFNSVAVDSSGNVYAAGVQNYDGTFTYGTGVSARGIERGNNVVLVKYDSNGTAQWARSVSTPIINGTLLSHFYSVAVDSFGNVYAAGQQGTGVYTYGEGVSTGTAGVVLVKYNSIGAAQWVRTVSESGRTGAFNSVAVDSSGNVYAAGYQYYDGILTYGTGVSAQGNYSGDNVVLVKYKEK